MVGQQVASAFTVTVLNDGPGNVLMTADGLIRNDLATVGVGWPLFVFSDTLSSVLIIDHSHADITIGSIDVVVPASVATEPIVWLLSRGGTNFDTQIPLRFDLTRNAVETWIDIQKRATGRLVIAGPVNNPTGWTHILHTDGDIESAVGGSSIITNALHLEAPKGGIGTVGNRLGVTLVQSVDRLRPTPLDDHLRTTFLRATARDTVALHLHGIDRVPSDSGARPASFVVYVDRVSSELGSVDLLLADSGRQDGSGGAARVHVFGFLDVDAPSQAAPAFVYNQFHDDHFRPDQVAGVTTRDPAAYVTAGLTLVDSTYRFEERVDAPEFESVTYPGTSLVFDEQTSSRTPVGSVPGRRTPGLVAARDIVVKDTGAAAATVINVVAWTDLADVLDPALRGVLDVDVAGWVYGVENTGDLRLGLVRSRTGDVHLTSVLGSILDGDPADAAAAVDPADVIGRSIVLRAPAGSIGTPTNFVETDLLDGIGTPAACPTDLCTGLVPGALVATALRGVYVTEVAGDLRVGLVTSGSRDRSLPTDVALTTRSGSIRGVGNGTDAVIRAVRVDLTAGGTGGIGGNGFGGALMVDTSIAGPGSGRLFAGAWADVTITEVDDELMVLAATSRTGRVTLTVPDTAGARAPPELALLTPLVSDPQLADATQPEDLVLIASGTALVGQGTPLPVAPHGTVPASGLVSGIWAKTDITLWVGDDVSAPVDTWIVAGGLVTIHGDEAPSGTNADPVGSTMRFAGVVGGLFDLGCLAGDATCPDRTSLTEIFGNADDDTVTFHETFLGARTHVFGSRVATNAGTAADGIDRFTVTRLQSMLVGLAHTLTLDGQDQGDTYLVETTGSQGAARNYVVNVLDTGSTGIDALTVRGTDASADVFLLRRFRTLAEAGWTPTRPAFVALLHVTLDDARASDPTGSGTVRPQDVQRVNYDLGLDDVAPGGLLVEGLGGDDTFATDDTSARAVLDGGAGDDTFQIGQLYGTQRNATAAPAGGDLTGSDVFGTTATTRGWLSAGISRVMTVRGGAGDDTFGVYANHALLSLLGEDGNDLFTQRAFALAQTTGDCTPDTVSATCLMVFRTDHPGVPMPLLTGTQVHYTVNLPVDIQGGDGFDKTVAVATEFADHLVVTNGGVFGAGLTMVFGGVEVVEVDAMEGDDTVDVLSTPAGVGVRVIAGLGSDVVDVAGDVVPGVVAVDAAGAPLTFSKRPHLLSTLDGPLVVVGGAGPARALWVALVLPGEANQPLFALAPLPPESQQVDLLLVLDDSNTVGQSATLTSTALTGLGMAGGLTFGLPPAHGEPTAFGAGITIGDTVEVVSLLLGSGNDIVRVVSTLVPGIDASTGVVAVHGGLTTVHGGGGDDTILVTGGGGPLSPLVLYGDTGQSGSWYAGSPTAISVADIGSKPFTHELGNAPRFVVPVASPFATAGDDVVDASAVAGAGWAIGVVAYGGAGNDTIVGSQAPDVLAGGSGADTIAGNGGGDLVFGDSGVDVDVRTRTLSVPTINTSTAPDADGLAAGADTLSGGAGHDVVFGDHGVVVQDTEEAVVGPDGYTRSATRPERIETAGRLRDLRTTSPLNGVADVITGGAGNDALFGGGGADTMSGDDGNDLAFGDHGSVTGVVDLAQLPLSMAPAGTPVRLDLHRHGCRRQRRVGPDPRQRRRRHPHRRSGRRPHYRRRRRRRPHRRPGNEAAGDGPETHRRQDGDDIIDGGTGNDVIAGDNADLLRTGGRLSPRLPGARRCTDRTTATATRSSPSAAQRDPHRERVQRSYAVRPHRRRRPRRPTATTRSPVAPTTT